MATDVSKLATPELQAALLRAQLFYVWRLHHKLRDRTMLTDEEADSLMRLTYARALELETALRALRPEGDRKHACAGAENYVMPTGNRQPPA